MILANTSVCHVTVRPNMVRSNYILLTYGHDYSDRLMTPKECFHTFLKQKHFSRKHRSNAPDLNMNESSISPKTQKSNMAKFYRLGETRSCIMKCLIIRYASIDNLHPSQQVLRQKLHSKRQYGDYKVSACSSIPGPEEC